LAGETVYQIERNGENDVDARHFPEINLVQGHAESEQAFLTHGQIQGVQHRDDDQRDEETFDERNHV
jgi:hypothetical protein